MPVTDLLERNHKLYGDEVALVELNPSVKDTRKTTWKEYDLVQQTSPVPYRREITWSIFDEKANRVANMLLSRGIQKGDRVAILMFNCLEWLPIYFGILKTGAIAVPFNFRFSAEEIQSGEAGNKISKIKKNFSVYISIDKDILDEEYSETNWSQGKMPLPVLERLLIPFLTSGNILGIDICGECQQGIPLPQYLEAEKINGETNKELFDFLMHYCRNF